MADRDVQDQHDLDLDAVWADVWNPESNAWAPSGDPFPQYGQNSPLSAYQGHGDQPSVQPMSEMYGFPPSGTEPSAAMNLLTDVKTPGQGIAPRQIIEHDVHVTETGSEVVRVRQTAIQANSNLNPVNLLEENPYRKRALIRAVPQNVTTGATTNFSGTGSLIAVTVPAGQTWTLRQIYFLYTASANVANRFPRVRVQYVGGIIVYNFTDTSALTASQTGQVSLAPGNPTQHTLLTGSSFSIQGNLPPGTVLPPGSTILIDAVGIDVADTMTLGSIMYDVTTGASSAAVFLAPRAEGGSAAAPSSWWKLGPTDPPLELKTQSGIDVLTAAAADTAVLQVYEELVRNGEQPLTGIV